MKILVLGAYGLIGLTVSKRLLAEGHTLVGFARSRSRGLALLPQADWIEADLMTLTQAESWAAYLDGIDAVVNASGLLQSGAGGDVRTVQRDAIIALIEACESQDNGPVFIQISAPGASPDSDTEFYRSKGEADKALKQSRLAWTIFRPGLVLSIQAYVGTSLLRMLAAFPVIQPLTLKNAKLQTVSVHDVAKAVSIAVDGRFAGQDFDLVEAEPHTLEALIAHFRAWLGFAPAKALLPVPYCLGSVIGRLGDIAGWLGWRPALRTTALRALDRNVIGDSAQWETALGERTSSLAETLRGLPSTAQERLYARAQLVIPVTLLILSAFWIVSGVIGLLRIEQAMGYLTAHMPELYAKAAVIAGALLDIAIGFGLLFRRLVRPACIMSIVTAGGYLLAGTLLTPDLWGDPLGPFIKIFPAMALALIVAALTVER